MVLKSKILLVDDNRVPRYYARQVLEADGYEVIEASGGDQAMKVLLAQHIDAVLLDINMPGIDGFEVCQMIRCQINNPMLPVLIVSGQDDPDSIEYAYEVGASDFNSKPVNWTILKIRLRQLVHAYLLSDELKLKKNQLQSLTRIIPDTILRLSADGKLLAMTAGVHVAGPIVDMLSRVNINESLPDEIANLFESGINKVLENSEHQQFEFELLPNKGGFHYEVRMSVTTDNVVIAQLRDITEHRHEQTYIQYKAYHDEVTGLHSFLYVQEQFRRHYKICMSNNSKMAVVRMEIVEFENITSVLGNTLVERLLRTWTSRLANEAINLCIGFSEMHVMLLGRVNDPGFVIILDGVANEDALQKYVAELDEKMCETIILDDYEVNVICRIGMALTQSEVMHDEAAVDVDVMMDKAEIALADARKSIIKNFNVYSEEAQKRLRGNKAMIKDIRSAIENGDLHLDYQPKIATDNNCLIGVEALIRWQHSEHGLVMPDTLIPLANENGLITSLGEFVLFEACRQSREWSRSSGKNLPVAMNLSAQQFNQRDLVEVIGTAMSTYSMDNGQLEVELTESITIENSDRVKNILRVFRDQGITTAIDDFGTGRSSLSCLQDFQFNTIKIDRSVVKQINNKKSALNIEAIINMGHVLGMQVVAEGVEEEWQRSFLKDKGCDVMQGFLMGRPMSAAAIHQHYLLS